MNDKELADAAVALGVLKWFETVDGHDGTLVILPPSEYMRTSEALSDWRVAGTLMEKCDVVQHGAANVECYWSERGVWEVHAQCGPYAYRENESLPRAIIEACVAALND